MSDSIPLPNKIGQKTKAESMPVVLPSDYNIAVDTTGLATDVKQDTIIGHVDGIEGKLDTLIARATGSLVPAAFDYIGYTDGGATETYVYKTGGSGGTTVKTVTITWTDASKAVLTSIAAT